MFRTTIKGLSAHKFRLMTTALAVMLGVAFMAGTFVLTDTVTKTFNDLFADVYKGTDTFVRARPAFDGVAGTVARIAANSPASQGCSTVFGVRSTAVAVTMIVERIVVVVMIRFGFFDRVRVSRP